jgi:hypothetical protein
MSSDPGATLGNEQHRTCLQCAVNGQPGPFEADDGIGVAFVCAEHGVRSVIDPFEGER